MRSSPTLGVFSPGSPPKAEHLAAGLAWLSSHGLRTRLGKTAIAGEGLHAGPPELRARDLEALLRDPEVGAILCARGGSGTLGLLPHLDPSVLANHPKPIIGMSDVTALHLACHRAGVRGGISAPMVVQLCPTTHEWTEHRWLALILGPSEPGPIPMPPEVHLDVLTQGGAAEGPLLPCNLSLLVALIGTPFIPELKGGILVLEDIHETPQSLDRLVAQLRLSGTDQGIAGVVLGQFTECLPRSPGVTEEEGRDVVRVWARSLGVPAIEGFPYGHEPLCAALPFGARARLTTDPPSLHLLEGP